MSNKQKKFEYTLSMKEKGFSVFEKGRKGLAAFNKEVKNGNKILSAAQGQVLGFLGAYAGFSGLNQMLQNTIANTKAVENFARTAGESVQDFQAHAYAVRTVGFEQEKLADISKDLKDKTGDFLETGGGEFADFFENVASKTGLAAEELIKMSGPDALIAVKKAMDDAGVSAERQIFYMEALANDASLLIPLLEKEGKAFKELAAEGKAMGVAMSEMDQEEMKEVVKAVAEMTAALEVLQRDVVIALAPSIKDFSEAVSENREELTDFAVRVATAAGAVMEFALNNQGLLILLGKIVITAGLVSKTISTLTNIWGGLNAASVAMTGSKMLPYLASLRTALLASASAGQLLGAALLIGWSGQQVMNAVSEYNAMRDAMKQTADMQQKVAAMEKKHAARVKAAAEQTGMAITTIHELDQAIIKGQIHFDKLSGTWKRGAGKMHRAADTVKSGFVEMETISKEKLSKMATAYEKYVGKVKDYQDQIADREKSLAEKIREINRSGMSDLGAWKDRKKEAKEYEKAARAAQRAGDSEEAIKLADKAAAAYEDLNKKVEKNGKVVVSSAKARKTAAEGMKRANDVAVKALEDQKKAAQEAADALDDASEGKLSDLAATAKDFGLSWEDAWEKMDLESKTATAEVEKRLDELTRDREVNIYINEIEKHASGGMAGLYKFAGGGSPVQFKSLSSPIVRGPSGVDKVPAMLTEKEFVQPVPSVDYYGVDVMEVLRRRLINRNDLRAVMGLRHFNTGGLAIPFGMQTAPLSLSSVGSSQSEAGNFSETKQKFTFHIHAAPGMGVEQLANAVMAKWERKMRMRG